MKPVKVQVSFEYWPEEPDPDHATGMSEPEYAELMDHLAELGATDVKIEKI